MSDSDSMTRQALEEAYKRLVPAVAHLISGKAGLAASTVVFVTWLLKNRGSSGPSIEDDEAAVARLIEEIRSREARLAMLEKARSLALRRGQPTGTIDEVISAEKRILENLRYELELRQLRITAMRALERLGSPEAVQAVKKAIVDLERSRGPSEQQYRVLKSLEEKWKRREISIVAIRQLLSYM